VETLGFSQREETGLPFFDAEVRVETLSLLGEILILLE
jgi:hypothetical protein